MAFVVILFLTQHNVVTENFDSLSSLLSELGFTIQTVNLTVWTVDDVKYDC